MSDLGTYNAKTESVAERLVSSEGAQQQQQQRQQQRQEGARVLPTPANGEEDESQAAQALSQLSDLVQMQMQEGSASGDREPVGPQSVLRLSQGLSQEVPSYFPPGEPGASQLPSQPDLPLPRIGMSDTPSYATPGPASAAVTGHARPPAYRQSLPPGQQGQHPSAAGPSTASGGPGALAGVQNEQDGGLSGSGGGGGGGGGGGTGRSGSKATRRGPMDEMRQLVRILVKVVPHSVAFLAVSEEGGGGNRISEDQIKSFLDKTLGEAPRPSWGVPNGWGHYLAVLFSWCSGREVSQEQAMRCAKREPGRSWEAIETEIAKLGLYPATWPLPLTKQSLEEARTNPKVQPMPFLTATPKRLHDSEPRGSQAPAAKRRALGPTGSAGGGAALGSGRGVVPGGSGGYPLGAPPSSSPLPNIDTMTELELWHKTRELMHAAHKRFGTTPLEQRPELAAVRKDALEQMQLLMVAKMPPPPPQPQQHAASELLQQQQQALAAVALQQQVSVAPVPPPALPSGLAVVPVLLQGANGQVVTAYQLAPAGPQHLAAAQQHLAMATTSASAAATTGPMAGAVPASSLQQQRQQQQQAAAAAAFSVPASGHDAASQAPRVEVMETLLPQANGNTRSAFQRTSSSRLDRAPSTGSHGASEDQGNGEQQHRQHRGFVAVGGGGEGAGAGGSSVHRPTPMRPAGHTLSGASQVLTPLVPLPPSSASPGPALGTSSSGANGGGLGANGSGREGVAGTPTPPLQQQQGVSTSSAGEGQQRQQQGKGVASAAAAAGGQSSQAQVVATTASLVFPGGVVMSLPSVSNGGMMIQQLPLGAGAALVSNPAVSMAGHAAYVLHAAAATASVPALSDGAGSRVLPAPAQGGALLPGNAQQAQQQQAAASQRQWTPSLQAMLK